MTVAPATVETITSIVAILATLAILSVVYRENPVYRFFEHLFVGVATGYGVVVIWSNYLGPGFCKPLTEGVWYVIIPALFSMLFYTIFFPRYAWLSRFLISILFGLGAGQVFRGFTTEVFPQITGSFLPLLPREAIGDTPAVTWWTVLDNTAFLVTLLSVMTYFFFSFRHEHKSVARTARLGRWLLMIAFGATFGSTVMARFSLLIDRLQFLFDGVGKLFGG